MPKKDSQHIIPNQGGGWSVRKTEASKATKVFDNKAAAVGYGKDVAKKHNSDLYIHRKDGTIIEKKSYPIPAARSIIRGSDLTTSVASKIKDPDLATSTKSKAKG